MDKNRTGLSIARSCFLSVPALLQFRSAMRAAGRVIGDLALAERAFASGLGRRRGLLELVHGLYDSEEAKGYDNEIDDCVDEVTDLHASDGNSGEVGLAKDHADDRGKDVFNDA